MTLFLRQTKRYKLLGTTKKSNLYLNKENMLLQEVMKMMTMNRKNFQVLQKYVNGKEKKVMTKNFSDTSLPSLPLHQRTRLTMSGLSE